jgi:pimeloyl-ACP methyl ester carboxylesterase
MFAEHELVRKDGARVFVTADGPRDAQEPALLILDGIGCSGWAFRRISPLLTPTRTVAFMHYRGHGRSPTPERPWSLGMHTFADDADAACDALGLDRVIAVGFSMGFQVCLEFYRRHRARVAGLVSLAGPSGRVLRNFQGSQLLGRLLPVIATTTRVARTASSRVWRNVLPSRLPWEIGLRTQVNAERIDPRDLGIYMRQLSNVNPELFVSVLEHAHRHCAADVLPVIDVPTLVIAGARDAFIPLETLRSMAFAIPGASWEVFAQATHALPAEYPKTIARRLESHAQLVARTEQERAATVISDAAAVSA